jgi:ADP-dependent NAD(P)H-hydrate dehydratase / NAD(P)H-hydrate epimerase
MANAGRAVAHAVQARFRPCRTLVLCGPGNNGGDGYVAARLLAEQGWPVAVAALAPPRAGTDAAWAAAQWHGPAGHPTGHPNGHPNAHPNGRSTTGRPIGRPTGRPIGRFAPDEAARAALVIDAVFGAGLARAVDGLPAETLRAARRVVAVDVPSGLDGATGTALGFAPQAMLTVTFFRLKPGHLLQPGREQCGEIVLADIGLPAAALAQARPNTFANLPERWPLPRLAAEGHKYSRGHVTVLGSATMTGAARLAANGARRAGAGMVTIAARGGGDVYRAGSPGLIVNESPLADLLEDKRRHVWVCGPGLGADAAHAALPALIAARRAVVADADAFTAFAGNPDAFRGAAVLTPHAGEFARVFGAPADRLSAARAAASRTGAVVLLKGNDTIIAAPDGRTAINANAPPWLGTAGAGDVLAGIIAGLLAQGMEPWEAAAAAAWLHGRAAASYGPGMVAEDLLTALPHALAATASPSTYPIGGLSPPRRKGVGILA